MPNIKSAIKRVNVIEKKTLRNSMLKSDYKTAIRKFEEAVIANKKDDALNLFKEATKKVDMACSKGVIKKNTASRRKSSLAKKLNSLNASKTATKATEKVADKEVEEKVAKKATTTAKKTTTKTAAKTTAKKAATKKTATKK